MGIYEKIIIPNKKINRQSKNINTYIKISTYKNENFYTYIKINILYLNLFFTF